MSTLTYPENVKAICRDMGLACERKYPLVADEVPLVMNVRPQYGLLRPAAEWTLTVSGAGQIYLEVSATLRTVSDRSSSRKEIDRAIEAAGAIAALFPSEPEEPR